MSSNFDLATIRAQFPALAQQVNDNPLIYLDNAATTQKPLAVLQAMDDYYRQDNANVHRAAHTLSCRATQAFEGARERVRAFLHARESREIIWTRGTTEAINLVAHSWGRTTLQPGDEILLSTLEHHANIVPWQQLALATGAQIRVIPLTPRVIWICRPFTNCWGPTPACWPSPRSPMPWARSIRWPRWWRRPGPWGRSLWWMAPRRSAI